MPDFLLVIDTECSDLPKKWDAPYTDWANWPYVVQVSWLVYQWDGTKVKQEDHYISNNDYTISESSRKIHHISDQILAEKGEERTEVLTLFRKDLETYQPVIIGHFVELDYHLLNVEFSRIGQLDNPLMHLPLFCTMQGATSLSEINIRHQPRLPDLYLFLFSEEQLFPHNALYDALAAAKCFFRERELLSLTNEKILSQRPVVKDQRFQKNTKKLGIVLVVAILFVILLVVYGLMR